jgi:hypothetical protein
VPERPEALAYSQDTLPRLGLCDVQLGVDPLDLALQLFGARQQVQPFTHQGVALADPLLEVCSGFGVHLLTPFAVLGHDLVGLSAQMHGMPIQPNLDVGPEGAGLLALRVGSMGCPGRGGRHASIRLESPSKPQTWTDGQVGA